ncbi:MAG: L-seryl-tRNA(Sec) selenium transferase [Planctomycetaceae bacterium]
MNSADRLRKLPSVDGILKCGELADLRDRFAHPLLSEWVRAAVEACRQNLLNGAELDDDATRQFVLREVRLQAECDDGQLQRHVINATGILLHTNLGRAPLADRAIARMNDAAAYASVELNLQTGRRCRRGERAMKLLATLAGSDDALVVNNCAAATMLVLHGTAAGREVVISRGQLVEIGGGFRLPEVFAAAGVTLKEIGTTNRTYLHDYERAISENTGAVIRVHRSNFRQTGFVTEPSIQELAAMQRPADLPVIDDVGSGCIHDLTAFGLQEPTVSASVRAGANVTLFSGDKLFGGPQCGIIVGRQKWIDRLRSSPLMRAIRVDKLTLAALEATTEVHLSGNAFGELPLLKMLSKDLSAIRAECEAIVAALKSTHAALFVDVVECDAEIGGGSVPGFTISSCAIRVRGSADGTTFDPDAIAKRLRTGRPAILPRISEDALLLDLRTVADAEFPALTERLRAALAGCVSGGA